LSSAIVQALTVLVALIILVLTHELGHFIAAKLCGIGVTEFFIGFGPRIWSFRRGRTEYGFKWFLVGGYVKILGMNPDEEVREEDWSRSYRGNPAWRRSLVVFSGSLVHFILACLVIFIAIWTLGVPSGDRFTTIVSSVGTVMEDGVTPTPAYAAGLKPGDEVLSIDGKEVSDWEELRAYIVDHPGREVGIEVRRGEEVLAFQLRLATRKAGEVSQGFLGVTPRPYVERYSLISSVRETFVWLGRASYGVGYSFYRVFTLSTWKQLLGISQPTVERPVTVVGATRLAGFIAQEGIYYLLNFFAFILLFLAYINLLPLPPLDGGYLLVLLLERIRGKEIDLRKLYPIAIFVLTLFGLLFVLTLRLDITNPINLP
jgi:membrane-associated protease RseP (regulator of RpoE activity)